MTDTAQLIAEIKKGNRRAMHSLYSMSVGRLTAVCRRYIQNEEDMKDILQECYIKIFKALNDFVSQNENSLNSWMTRIVVNESLGFIKKQRRQTFLEVTDNVPDIENDEPQADTHGISTDDLYDMICELPDGYRTIINLYIIEEYSHKEIAAMLGISEYTSASQLFHAKKALAKMINKKRTGK